ncbi:hypothetical protein MTR67_029000, partial [Solanum verrucosum]
DDFYSDNSKMVSWGVIEFGPPPKFIGRHVTEFLDIDVDRMSYFELRGYINELGYTVDCDFFIKWDGLLVFVDNDKAPLELEFVPNVSDSGVGEESFNEASNPNNQPPTSTFHIPTTGPSETSSTQFEDQSTTVPPPSPSTVPSSSTVPPPSTVPPLSPSTVPLPSSVPSYDPIIDNDPIDDEVEDESGSEGDTNDDTEVDSDVHQEYIDIKESKRHFKRSQRRSRGTNSYQINVDEKGPDIGYDETNIGIRESLVVKLEGDEPYYLSDEAPSFEIDDETGWGDGEEVDQVVYKPVRRKKTLNRVVFDATSEKIVWELGLVFGTIEEFRVAVTRYAVQEHIQIEKYVNEPDRVRVRCCKETCPWLLCTSKDKTSGDVIVKTYNPVHKCLTSTHNYFCNSKFLATKYKERITQQPNINIVLLKDIIRKELDINVGRTTVRRARTRVLQEIMGDHIVEYGKIFDYKDEILRSNPGSTCVVKVGEEDETGQKFFEGFYVCFNALKKAFFGGARRLIGFDGCFLKVKNDLDLGEGHQLSIITDMQKGLEIVVENVLPLVEHRKCARHVIANWCKNWKGVERRRVFWRIAKSTFEVEMMDNIQAMKKLEQECLDDLLWYNLNTWCKKYFQDYSKCDVVDNNMAESFNAWILPARGIPCPHGVAALHYKELEPIHYVASCYSKETYLSTYAYFIQPMNNMKMWPTSNNPIVKPPKIKKLPGRPGKVRRKEADESRKTGKLSKRGAVMTCNKCGTQGHNKRGCPTRNQAGPSQSTELSYQAQATESGRGRDIERVAGGRARASSSTQPPRASSQATTNNESGRGRGTGRVSSSIGVPTQSHGTATNTEQPGLPSRRVINTGTRVTKRANVVTGDIGYTPVRGFKWKGKTTITVPRKNEG